MVTKNKRMKKIILCLSFFLIMVVGRAKEKNNEFIYVSLSYNHLATKMMHDPYVEYAYGGVDLMNALQGGGLQLAKPLRHENLRLCVGGILLYESFGSDLRPKEHTTRGGGLYGGVQFIPVIGRIGNGEKPVIVRLNSMLGVGFFSFAETKVLIDNAYPGLTPQYAIDEKNRLSGPGSIMEFGPTIEKKRLSLSVTGKTLITGGNQLNITTLGSSVSLCYKFNLL